MTSKSKKIKKSPKIHHGHAVEKAIKESGISKTVIAQKLRISRPTLYSLFEKETIDWRKLEQIAVVIHYDFITELRGSSVDLNAEPKTAADEIAYWKNKYTTLLEEHLELMRKNKTDE